MILRYLIFCLFLSISAYSTAKTVNLQLVTLNEIQLPTPPTLADKRLGTVLASSGSIVAVSAGHHDNNASGSVYIYEEKKSWQLIDEISTAEPKDNFAKRMVLMGDRLVVSADRDDSKGVDSGAVYIFERQLSGSKKWQQTAKLTAPDAREGDHFGEAVFLANNTLYVGAPLHDKGKVYIYTRDPDTNKWMFQSSIEPTDSTAFLFGFAITQDKNTLVISAPASDDKILAKTHFSKQIKPKFTTYRNDNPDLDGFESGVLFVYELNAGKWIATERLSPSNRWSYDHFGENIAIEGNIIAASINHKFVFDALGAGSVYLFEKKNDRWKETTILTAKPPQTNGYFGTSLSILDQHILVGANKTSTDGFNSGKVFLFSQDSNNSWQIIHQLSHASVQAHDQFGLSVALDAEKMLVASKNAVYSFQNKLMLQNSAIFYPENNMLQLDEVAVTGLGVYQATLKLSGEKQARILTLTGHRIRKELGDSRISYSTDTGQLHIPRLAIQHSNGEMSYHEVVLLQLDNENELQFKVESIENLLPANEI